MLKKIFQSSPKTNKISYFHIGYMGVFMWWNFSNLQPKKKEDYDLYKGLFWEKFPQSHIFLGEQKKSWNHYIKTIGSSTLSLCKMETKWDKVKSFSVNLIFFMPLRRSNVKPSPTHIGSTYFYMKEPNLNICQIKK